MIKVEGKMTRYMFKLENDNNQWVEKTIVEKSVFSFEENLQTENVYLTDGLFYHYSKTDYSYCLILYFPFFMQNSDFFRLERTATIQLSQPVDIEEAKKLFLMVRS